MRYLFGILIICGCFVCGKFILRKYIKRDEQISLLIKLTGMLKNNLEFRQKRIEEIFDEFQESNKSDFVTNLKEIVKGKPLTKSSCNLKEDEMSEVNNFFSELGDGNSEVEKNKLDGFIFYLNELKEDSKQERKNNEGLINKLSISVGAILAILIL